MHFNLIDICNLWRRYMTQTLQHMCEQIYITETNTLYEDGTSA